MQNMLSVVNGSYHKEVKEAAIIFLFGLPFALCLLLMQKYNYAVAVIGILLSLVLFVNYDFAFYFLVFSIPFIRLGFVDVGVTVLPCQVIGLIGVLSFFSHKHIIRKTKFIMTPNDGLLILFFIIVVLISVIKYQAAMDMNPDLWGGRLRNSLRSFAQIAALGLMISIYFFTINFLTSKEKVIKSIRILLAATFIICLYGLYQAVGYHLNWPYIMSTYRFTSETWEHSGIVAGMFRVNSLLGEAKGLAFYLMPIIFLVMSLLALKATVLKYRLLIFLNVLFIIIFLMTFARSAMVLFVFSAVLFLFLLGRFYGLSGINKFLPALFIILFVLLISSFLLIQVTKQFDYDFITSFVERIESLLTLKDDHADIVSLDVALRLIPEHPIIGIGWGNFSFYAPCLLVIENVPNQFLHIMVETGIVGLLIFSLFLFCSFMYAFNNLRRIKDIYWRKIVLSLLIMVVSYTICIMYYSYWFNYPYLWIMLGMLKASARLGLEEKENQTLKNTILTAENEKENGKWVNIRPLNSF
ncbi:MAG: O-antigen ligase family protein [Sedimentisphaerales bacterium]|nr:O-antigen ligase family protein [Sedimentisphaerales bacterium]